MSRLVTCGASLTASTDFSRNPAAPAPQRGVHVFVEVEGEDEDFGQALGDHFPGDGALTRDRGNSSLRNPPTSEHREEASRWVS
ncbi:MAG: hypothetical protein QOI78_3116 [Actinomycetota bacterium]|jgi:hypothetical protein|nr:hypothetical protein [Actinomycetota bacterium]